MRKNLSSFAISIIVIIVLLSGAILTVDTNGVTALQDGDYTYTVSGYPAFATITKYTGTSQSVTIPSSLGGYPTRIIGYQAFVVTGAFHPPSSLKSVTIPDSITTIGNMAFAYSSNLISIKIGTSVTTIGQGAFTYCTSLTSVTIPNNVVNIEGGIIFGAFSYDSSLKSVTVGSGVTSIGVNTFAFCSNLQSITFLGLHRPSTELNWIGSTNTAILGHAYSDSNFPRPGSEFDGLTMGESLGTLVIPPASTTGTSTNNDPVSLQYVLGILIAIFVVAISIYLVWHKRKGKIR